MTTFSKKVKMEVVAISLGSSADRVSIGIHNHNKLVYRAGLEVDNSERSDIRYFPFIPHHVTVVLDYHPSIGDEFVLTFEKIEKRLG